VRPPRRLVAQEGRDRERVSLRTAIA